MIQGSWTLISLSVSSEGKRIPTAPRSTLLQRPKNPPAAREQRVDPAETVPARFCAPGLPCAALIAFHYVPLLGNGIASRHQPTSINESDWSGVNSRSVGTTRVSQRPENTGSCGASNGAGLSFPRLCRSAHSLAGGDNDSCSHSLSAAFLAWVIVSALFRRCWSTRGCLTPSSCARPPFSTSRVPEVQCLITASLWKTPLGRHSCPLSRIDQSSTSPQPWCARAAAPVHITLPSLKGCALAADPSLAAPLVASTIILQQGPWGSMPLMIYTWSTHGSRRQLWICARRPSSKGDRRPLLTGHKLAPPSATRFTKYHVRVPPLVTTRSSSPRERKRPPWMEKPPPFTGGQTSRCPSASRCLFPSGPLATGPATRTRSSVRRRM